MALMFSKSLSSFWRRNIEENHLLLCVPFMTMSRHPSPGVFSSAGLWVVGLQGSWQERCSLSAVLQLGCLPKAGTCMPGE